MKGSDTGRIFDVRRFSVHDGSGIRTTIFFKGCPLRCVWCHNPEGIEFERRPIWFAGKCMHCGGCIEASVCGGIAQKDDRIRICADAQEDWDRIMDACPTGALRWDSRDATIEDLMEEIRRDKPFYAHGGGGVTLSGGDPLMQADFADKLLEECRSEGIHTAIETELHAPWSVAERVLGKCDLIYADLKLVDARQHELYTGVSNERILSNMRSLLTGELRERVIVRTPMIPGITDTRQNLAGISCFLSELYPDVRLELLNYNPLAAAKYELVGREYCFRENPSRHTLEAMQALCAVARENGIKHAMHE